jgi:sugar O-acyltransferase (sialic acid O-acetyltransferase NeuD family)
MSTPVIVWGATGQARVLADFLPTLGYRIEVLVDRNPQVAPPLEGVPILLGEAGFREWASARRELPAALVAIGGDRGADRLELQEVLRGAGCRILTVIHPRAIAAASAQFGSGCQILAGAVVGAGAVLGDAVIVNTRAGVDHECRIADGVHVGPGATLCGLVTVGRCTLIGAGAVVLPRVRIGSHTVIGAGAVVTRDVPDNVIAFGNPARIIRPRSSRAVAP